MNETNLKRGNIIHNILLPNITKLINFNYQKIRPMTETKVGEPLTDIIINDELFSIEFKEFLEKHKERLQNEFDRL